MEFTVELKHNHEVSITESHSLMHDSSLVLLPIFPLNSVQ